MLILANITYNSVNSVVDKKLPPSPKTGGRDTIMIKGMIRRCDKAP